MSSARVLLLGFAYALIVVAVVVFAEAAPTFVYQGF
jgi:hypothetical protein